MNSRSGRMQIYVHDFGSGTETMIGGTAGILGRSAATPDGTGIAYTLSAPGAAFGKIVLQTLSTGAVRTVTTQADGEPTLDRTGAQMVVTSLQVKVPARPGQDSTGMRIVQG